jgi:ribosome-associated protein
MESFKIKGEYIELIKLLKAAGFAENGGEAQNMVVQELVMVNSALETRKRAKLKSGDVVTCPPGKKIPF